MLASSLAFHGKVSQNTSLMTESYKWYGVGLRAHQKQLQILSNHKKKPSIEEICMAIMLSFFEIISSTTHTAYFQHIMGAMKLLEMVGPEGCREATIGRLYQVVKAQMVCYEPHASSVPLTAGLGLCGNHNSQIIVLGETGMDSGDILRTTKDGI